MKEITQEMLEAWPKHPVTEHILKRANEIIMALKNVSCVTGASGIEDMGIRVLHKESKIEGVKILEEAFNDIEFGISQEGAS